MRKSSPSRRTRTGTRTTARCSPRSQRSPTWWALSSRGSQHGAEGTTLCLTCWHWSCRLAESRLIFLSNRFLSTLLTSPGSILSMSMAPPSTEMNLGLPLPSPCSPTGAFTTGIPSFLHHLSAVMGQMPSILEMSASLASPMIAMKAWCHRPTTGARA